MARSAVHTFHGLRVLNLGLALSVCLVSCAPAMRAPRPVEPPPSVFQPAGSWRYEDRSGAYVIRIDEHGNGRYPWQKGVFKTGAIEGRRWTGTWHQAGNDREGGFELTLSADFSQAHGRWWYTRIGVDSEPTKPGGQFSLIRVAGPDD